MRVAKPFVIPVRSMTTSRLKLPAIATSSGACSCGNVTFLARFTTPLGAVQARKCDCDFCVARGAKYASDPVGALEFRVKGDEDSVHLVKQEPDSNAEFLICGKCDTLAGVVFKDRLAGHLIGTINASLVPAGTFAGEVVVSPKKLDAAQKIQRWKENWFSDVIINYRSI
jgi:hypothetical protein